MHGGILLSGVEDTWMAESHGELRVLRARREENSGAEVSGRRDRTSGLCGRPELQKHSTDFPLSASN